MSIRSGLGFNGLGFGSVRAHRGQQRLQGRLVARHQLIQEQDDVDQVRSVSGWRHQGRKRVRQVGQQVRPQTLHEAVQEGDDASAQGPVVRRGLHTAHYLLASKLAAKRQILQT